MSSAAASPPLDLRLRASATSIRWALAGLFRTWRVRVVAGVEILDSIDASGPPVILCFWHDQLLILSPFLRRLLQRGVGLTVFTSRSKDGELVAQLALRWGADAVRGSSSRGGSDALRELYRIVKSGRSSPVIVPDGPRGPRREAKPGAILLARMSGAPIVPLACAAAAGLRLKSWDRMLLPLPFTRVAVAVGPPEALSREATAASDEAQRLRLEARLNALVETAESATR